MSRSSAAPCVCVKKTLSGKKYERIVIDKIGQDRKRNESEMRVELKVKVMLGIHSNISLYYDVLCRFLTRFLSFAYGSPHI